MQLKRIHLLPGALLALGLASPVFAADQAKPAAKAEANAEASAAAKADAKSTAEIEAKLEAARARLEAAAREVAELSGELSGPMINRYEIVRRGSGPHASIGISIDDQDDKPGVLVESVSPNGPASKAGLKTGDVLVSVDGKDLRKPPEGQSPHRLLVNAVRSKKPGEKVTVEYQREGKTHKADITTESMDITRFISRHRDRVPPVPAVPAVPAIPAIPDLPDVMMRGWRDHSIHEMELITLTPRLGSYFGTDKGVLVVRAPRDSDLKLEEGDVIVDISGRVPQSSGHALRILRSYQPGETATVNVLRNRKSMKLDYTVPKREAATGAMWSRFPEFEFDRDSAEPPAQAVKPAPQSAPSPPPAPAAGLRT